MVVNVKQAVWFILLLGILLHQARGSGPNWHTNSVNGVEKHQHAGAPREDPMEFKKQYVLISGYDANSDFIQLRPSFPFLERKLQLLVSLRLLLSLVAAVKFASTMVVNVKQALWFILLLGILLHQACGFIPNWHIDRLNGIKRNQHAGAPKKDPVKFQVEERPMDEDDHVLVEPITSWFSQNVPTYRCKSGERWNGNCGCCLKSRSYG